MPLVSRLMKILAVGLAVLAALAMLTIAYGETWLEAGLIQAVYAQKQRRLAIDGGLGLTVWPDLGVRLERVSLSEAGSDTEFAAADGLRAAVALRPLFSGRIEAGRIELTGLRARLVRHADGRLNIDDLLAPGGAGGPVQVRVAGLALTGDALSWHDEAGGRTTELTNVALETGPIAADTGAGGYRIESLTLAARLAGDAPVALRLAVRGVAGTGQRLDVEALALDVAARAGDRSLKLALATPLAADLGGRTLSLERLEGRLEVADPRLPMKSLRLPLSGELRADLGRGSGAARLASRLDDSALALRVDAARLAPPSLSFRLDIDRLDLDRYLPADTGKAKPAGQSDLADLSALKGMDLRGQVTVDELHLAGIRTRQLRLDVTLRDGRLEYAEPPGRQATRRVSR